MTTPSALGRDSILYRTTARTASPVDDDAAVLASHGYRQRLNRSLGAFSCFAAGFSYMSILTGMFQLFGFGYVFGGPLLFWAWLLVLGGQLSVALVFAELSARYPIAGSVYQWSKKTSPPGISWMAGWLMLTGSIATLAAVSIATQVLLPAVSPVFVVFDDPARNAVFLGSCVIALSTVVNVLGVRVMALINNIGVAVLVGGVVLIAVLLCFHLVRGPEAVFTTHGQSSSGSAWSIPGHPGTLLLAAIMPAYVLYGFDTAGSLAEETKDPRRTTPRALLRALISGGLAGAILLLLLLMAAPTLDPGVLASGGLPMLLSDTLGSTIARVLVVDVAVAALICVLAVHTATIRLAFSMARDHALPLSRSLSQVNDARSPVLPAVVSGLLATALLVVNVGNPALFLVITSVAIAIVYLAYLLVTGPVLWRRRAGWPEDQGRNGLFFMGPRVGVAVNVVAVGYGSLMAMNLLWPRSEVYGGGLYRWGGLLAVLGVVTLGAVYFVRAVKGKDGRIAAGHRYEEAGTAPVAAPGRHSHTMVNDGTDPGRSRTSVPLVPVQATLPAVSVSTSGPPT